MTPQQQIAMWPTWKVLLCFIVAIPLAPLEYTFWPGLAVKLFGVKF